MNPADKAWRLSLFALMTLGTAFCGARASAESGVKITEVSDRLRIEIDGELFSEYYFKDVSRPSLYPIMAPGGINVTRDWPMRDSRNEEHDHPHHRAWWYAHGSINGVDFWSEEKGAGLTVHDKFLEVKSGEQEGVIRSANSLMTPEGRLVCTDERTIRVLKAKDARIFDFEVTVKASAGEVVFGDTKEGAMAIRLAESMRLKPTAGNVSKKFTKQEIDAVAALMKEENRFGPGHIVNSEGVKDAETWGKRAKWCDYWGPVNGRTVGVAIFDHPSNPRHPTWWHVRDYGLFAANPFGVHDFEKKPAGSGNLRLAPGETVTFRYRFFIHAGDTTSANVGARYDEYAK